VCGKALAAGFAANPDDWEPVAKWPFAKRGQDPFRRNGLEGASHKRVLSPFRDNYSTLIQSNSILLP